MMLEFQTLVFYGFSIVALSAALGVVFSRNPVYSALFLVAAFVACAGIWMLLHAEFLAIVLVLVYVGAVMVLFLFVLMMLDIHIVRRREGVWRYLPAAAVFCGGLVWALTTIVADARFAASPRFAAGGIDNGEDNTRALGSVLYTDYAYPFELAAALLLVAIVAAVALTLRRRKNAKYADPAKQSLADSRRLVRLVSMPASPVPEQFNPKKDKTEKNL